MSLTNFAISLGFPMLWSLPNGMQDGPFSFGAVITDNATTANDLTAAAAIRDQQIKEFYGGAIANPKCAILAFAAEVHVETLTETEEIANFLDENLYLSVDQKGEVPTIIPFFKCASYGFAGTRSGDAAAAMHVWHRRDPYVLPQPTVIDLSQAGWDIKYRAAVNVVGAPVARPRVHGVAFDSEHVSKVREFLREQSSKKSKTSPADIGQVRRALAQYMRRSA